MNTQFIHNRLLDLVNIAAGGDYYYTDELYDRISNHSGVVARSKVEDILRNAKIPLAKIVRIDLDKIYAGEEPIYFLPYQKVVANYKNNHYLEGDFEEGLSSGGWDEIAREIKKNMEERKKYGASLGPYRDGLACFNEQKYFYESLEWKRRAKVVRVLDRFTCKSCGKNMDSIPDKLHVHHEYPIQSIFSFHFGRNFETARLRTLCETCHENLHATKVRRTYGFVSASEEDIEEQKEYFKKLSKAHDQAKECRFCFGS